MVGGNVGKRVGESVSSIGDKVGELVSTVGDRDGGSVVGEAVG